MAPEAGEPRPGVDRRGVDEVRRDLDARDEVARRDDLAVEHGEDLERVDPVDPLQVGDADVQDARRLGEQVDPALGRPADGQAGPGDGGGEPEGGVVLVELARPRGTSTLTGSPGSAAASAAGRPRSAGGPSTSATPRSSGRASGSAPRGARARAGPG